MAECYYEPTPATDGATMNPVPGAVFQVFELSDTGFTSPLSLRVGAGNPTTTVAASESLATLPGVWVTSPNFEHIWKSGTFEWRRDSIDGAKAAIQDAKVAAVDAAASSDSSAQSSADSAQAAKDAAALVDAPADTVMAGVAANSGSAFATQLNATIAEEAVPRGSSVNSATSASAPFLEVISNGGAAGLHLTNSAGFSGPYIFGLGKDVAGDGMVLPNKANGRMIVGDQRETVTDAASYWLHATNRSTAAPLVRLEQNVAGAAPALQLLAFNDINTAAAPTATQQLLYIGTPAGEAGRIYASSGKLRWLRDIRIQNQAAGEVASYLELSTSDSANSANTRKSWHGASADVFFGATGAAGLYYPYRVNRAASSYEIETAGNLTPADPLNPKPSEVTTWDKKITVGHTGIAFFGGTKTPKQTVTGSRADGTALNSLLNALAAFGLITNSSTA